MYILNRLWWLAVSMYVILLIVYNDISINMLGIYYIDFANKYGLVELCA